VKYAVEMGSGAMIYIPSFIQIDVVQLSFVKLSVIKFDENPRNHFRVVPCAQTVGRVDGRTDRVSELSTQQGLELAENSSKMSALHWSTPFFSYELANYYCVLSVFSCHKFRP
jgi:hypothetical protein